jgi:DNA-binding NarL/FixJ family response regulator
MTCSPKIRVLVADDHVCVRQGLCGLLRAEGSFEVVGEAENGREAVMMAAARHPSVVLMDIAMPVLNGVEAARQILGAHATIKVIVLSAHNEDAYVERAIAAGVSGFLEKQSSFKHVARAIREVAVGQSYYSAPIARRLKGNRRGPCDRCGPAEAGHSRLTAREFEVLQLVAEGSANKQSAAELGISIKTVEKHRQRIMDKLNLHDTAGLTRYAIATGIIENSIQLRIREG